MRCSNELFRLRTIPGCYDYYEDDNGEMAHQEDLNLELMQEHLEKEAKSSLNDLYKENKALAIKVVGEFLQIAVIDLKEKTQKHITLGVSNNTRNNKDNTPRNKGKLCQNGLGNVINGQCKQSYREKTKSNLFKLGVGVGRINAILPQQHV